VAMHGTAIRPAALGTGMVFIQGGTFWMGSTTDSFPDAHPQHQVKLKSFWIDETPVINDEFARFVKATGYKTVDERKPDPREFPGVPAEKLVPGALAVTPPTEQVSKRSNQGWWRYVAGANWKHPEGPQSDLKNRGKHPVVQIAWEDAIA